MPASCAFLGWLNSTLRNEDRAGGDAVDIVTFHAAKGLEWSVVHVAGLEEGFVPIHHAETEDDLDEERRLLYVALTRARDELHCTWARKRAFGSRSLNRSPSPWLAAIETTVGVAPSQVDRKEGARRAHAARAALGSRSAPADGPDRELFEALRALAQGRRPPQRTCPPSSSSTTPPWPPWPSAGRPAGPSCWTSRASAR